MNLGEMLVKANVLTELQLKTALAEQKQWGGKLGHILVEMNYLTEELLMMALSRQLGMPMANLTMDPALPPAVLARLDRALCERHLVVPAAYHAAERTLDVAMADPLNLTVLDELRARTGLRVVPFLAGEKSVALALARLFGSAVLEGASADDMKLLGNNGSTLVRAPPEPPAGSPPPAPHPVSFPPHVSAARPAPFAPQGLAPSREQAEQLRVLEAEQQEQTRIMAVLAEMLAERGVFNEQEFLAHLRARG